MDTLKTIPKTIPMKDEIHSRPSEEFSQDITLDCSREIFFSNSENKQKFINMLGEKLSLSGFDV